MSRTLLSLAGFQVIISGRFWVIAEAQNFGQLSHYARKALRRMRKRPTLVIAFWRQAELFPL
jgi:hypothetical protein